MEYDVRVLEIPACRVVAKRLEVAAEQIGPAIGRTLGEVYEHIARSPAEPVGEPFVIYHERPTPTSGWKIEVCAPVSGPVPVPAGYALVDMPGGSVATTTHVGPYEDVAPAYTEIEAFIRTHGLEIAGPPREIYLSEPGTPPSETVTRIEFPVARVPVAAR